MDFKLNIDNATGTASMTFDRAENIMNNIYTSLMIRRGSYFADPAFGSRLHLLMRAKNTDATARMAMDYAREALQWMLDTGRARKIDVYAQRERMHWLKLLIEVTPQGASDVVAFEHFIEVI